MKKRAILTISISIFIFLLMAGGVYFGLAHYYKDGFCYGTWINDVYCTGKSIEEVNEVLAEGFGETEFKISFGDGEAECILLEDISIELDYREPLEELLKSQNPQRWIFNLNQNRRNHLLPKLSFDETALRIQMEKLPEVEYVKEKTMWKVEIAKTREGYRLINEKTNVLNSDILFSKVCEGLREGIYEIQVTEDCYENLPLTKQDKDTLALWKKVEEFQNCKISYDMGDEIVPLDASVVCDWIGLDETGNFLTDEEGNLLLAEGAIESFVEELADSYNTLGTERTFHATRGDTVTVEGGTYGNKLNQKAEIKYLKEAFAEKKEEIRVPEYLEEAFVRGKNDIGGTYIEIDMTEQMMYYYVDSEIYVETPIVTGNMVRNMATPEGTCFVYNKQKSRVLRGANYASFVNFWVPVRGNIGIHDAPWRAEYGEEIYKTNGSHGCINTPYDEMKKIYEHVEIGTPVVMFY